MKDRKIPNKGLIADEIKKVLERRLKVESQEDMCALVLKRLKRIDKSYTLSPMRAKRVALSVPQVDVKAKTKKTPKMKRIDKCPICESPIAPLKVKNLLNKQITIGYKCTACRYESDLEAFMPMKYIFIWNKQPS